MAASFIICPSVSSKCRLQTAADHCFQHANGNETTIVPLFSNPENNGLQPVCSLYFVLTNLLFSLFLHFLLLHLQSFCYAVMLEYVGYENVA